MNLWCAFDHAYHLQMLPGFADYCGQAELAVHGIYLAFTPDAIARCSIGAIKSVDLLMASLQRLAPNDLLSSCSLRCCIPIKDE